METLRVQRAHTLHPGPTNTELQLGCGERVAGVRSSVDVRVGHGGHVLGVLLLQLGRSDGVEGDILEVGSVLVEDLCLGPGVLVFLLGGDEGVALVGVLDLELARSRVARVEGFLCRLDGRHVAVDSGVWSRESQRCGRQGTQAAQWRLGDLSEQRGGVTWGVLGKVKVMTLCLLD